MRRVGWIALLGACASSTPGGGDGAPDAGSIDGVLVDAEPASTGDDPFPEGAISFYLSTSCPSGWAPYEDALGRTIVPVADPGDVGVAVGAPLTRNEERAHRHAVTGAVDLSETSFAGIRGGGNGGVAQDQVVEATIETDDGPGGLPYVQLQICRKEEAASLASAPSGLIAYYEAACPSAWSVVSAIAGRILVGAPAEGVPGATFGGAPLAPGEQRTHTHAVNASMDTNSHGIALVSGCCAGGYAADGTYGFQTTSAAAAVGVPYLQLLACAKD